MDGRQKQSFPAFPGKTFSQPFDVFANPEAFQLYGFGVFMEASLVSGGNEQFMEEWPIKLLAVGG